MFLGESLTGLVPDRWIYLRLINHPVISVLYRKMPGQGAPPSYIPASNFAYALVDTLISRHVRSAGKPQAIAGSLTLNAVRDAKTKDLAIGHALQPLVAQAPTVEAALKNIEGWYDSEWNG